jgi:hypothetical protein
VRSRSSSSFKLVLVFILAALASLPAFAEETVYVTKTGAKYHRASCGSLRYSSRPMALTEAAALYGPCKNCRPPVPSVSGQPKPAAPLVSPPVERGAPARDGRCLATTKKGTRCLRNARPGEAYCWQHAR